MLVVDTKKDSKRGKPAQDSGPSEILEVKNAAVINPEIARALLSKRHFIVE
jgi:hypothetical protein